LHLRNLLTILQTMRTIRLITTIDGGGIRGILPLKIIDYIDQQIRLADVKCCFNSLTDMVAGTSTGALISAALIIEDEKGNPRFTANDLLNLYTNRGPQIFSKDRPTNESPFKMVLESSFGEMKLKALKKHYLFVSYDERGEQPFVFSDRECQYRDVLVSKALLASSAIRPHFQPIELNGKLLSDGIVTAKNPAEIAYRHAKLHFPDDILVLLSFGTGALPLNVWDEVEHEVKRVHEKLEDLAINNWQFIYHRFEPELKRAKVDMDDTSAENINALLDAADQYIQANKGRIDKAVQKLMKLKKQVGEI
jgi:uncharacterized protein